MLRLNADGKRYTFPTTEAAAEWLLTNKPGHVVVNGHDISGDLDYDAYGVTLGAVEFALEEDES